MMHSFNTYLEQTGEYGIVEQMHQSIAILNGLPGARAHELVVFETGQIGEVFMLEEEQMHVLVFSREPVTVGTRVARTNSVLSIPVGEEYVGTMITPLGDVMTGKKHLNKSPAMREVDTPPLGIAYRKRIKRPLLTGVTLIDMMVPLGKGQKELIIGDRKTGKTAFLLSTIKQQVQEGAIAIYAAIGKKMSDIKKVQEFLEKENLMEKTIIVATTSSESPSMIFLTPYSAITLAEYFRDCGKDVLIVFDDLSTHGKFYREIALLSKRFPGRDSYPGDIFYTHARLLERVGNFLVSGKEVAITALPVIEIVEGDLTGYIPTNVMGMTDGHIFFDSNIYSHGRRPAVNIALSVTRVGRQSQSQLLRSINREVTSFLAQYEKMQNLSHFGAELTESTKQLLVTGEHIYRFFSQPVGIVVPLPVQLILFSLLWLKVFPDVSEDVLHVYRMRLLEAYQREETQKLFASLLNVESLNDLLTNVTKEKEELLTVCIAK